jgi:hypothetical protein
LATTAAAAFLGVTGYAAAGGTMNASLLDTTGTTSTNVTSTSASTTATTTDTETTPTTTTITSPTTTAHTTTSGHAVAPPKKRPRTTSTSTRDTTTTPTIASSPTTTAKTPKKMPVTPAAAPVAASSASFPIWVIVGFAVAGVLILSGLGGFLYTRTRR